MNLNNLQVRIDMIRNHEMIAKTCEYLYDLLEKEEWGELGSLIGDEEVETMKADIELDSQAKADYLANWKEMAIEETDRFNRNIKQSLKDATSSQVLGSLGHKLLGFDKVTDDLEKKANFLAVAFTDRLTDLIFPAAQRAARLTNLIVKDAPSPEAEKFLEQACLCYFYELFSPCGVMCRAALEDSIEKRINKSHIDPQLKRTEYTLGKMLSLAARPESRGSRIVPPEVWREVDCVNRLGGVAVHERPLTEDEAWECLVAARTALKAILD